MNYEVKLSLIGEKLHLMYILSSQIVSHFEHHYRDIDE